MKASRAYIAGLGTTGVLLAALVLLLFVVGAVVAFNGSSVSDGIRQLEGLVVDRDEPVGGPALAAAEAAPTAGGVSPRPPASVLRARAPGGSAGPAPSSSAATADAPSGAGGTIPGVPAGAPALGSTGGGGGQPRLAPDATADTEALSIPGSDQSRQNLGQTTQGLTDEVGSVVEGVDPRLGETVQGLGQGAAQLVGGLTGGR